MPKYRVDVFLDDTVHGCVSHIGSATVQAPNKSKAMDMGYERIWDESLRGQAGISIIVHPVPQKKEV